MTYDDFRGIAITPILCKVFEYCFLEKYQSVIASGVNQFGFEKGVGCTQAIYACRNIVDHFVQSGSTINMCALDLSKTFDKASESSCVLYQVDEKKYSRDTANITEKFISML